MFEPKTNVVAFKPRKAVAKKPAAKKLVMQKPEPKGKDGGKRSLVPQLPRKN